MNGRPVFITVCCLLLMAVGCAKPVVITTPVPAARPTTPPAARTVVVAVDHLGDIYPYDPDRDDRLFSGRYTASLWNYYRFRNSRSVARNDSAAARWSRVAARYGVPTNPAQRPPYALDAVSREWADVQDRLYDEIRESILRVSDQGRIPLVVLVHGFNAGDPRPGYDAIRESILEQAYPGAKRDSVAFLELHWDGSEGASLRVIDAWWKGQGNAFPVGLALRRLLNTLPESMPVRIVTHSLGGTVASVALWNVDRTININRARAQSICPAVLSGAQRSWLSRRRFRPRDEWYCLYSHRQRDTIRHRTPRTYDLRVGMIVPAMPTETFLDDNSLTPRENGARIQRIVVGINPEDYAVTRGAGNLEAGCRARIGALNLGGTCAAVDSVSLERDLLSRCRSDGDTIAHLIRFTDWPDAPKVFGRQDHALTVYARRPEMPRFLSLVFDPAVIPDPSLRCRPYREDER